MAKPSAVVAPDRPSGRLQAGLHVLPLCRDACRRWFLGLACVGLAGLAVREYLRLGWQVLQWDLMLITGVAAFILGVGLAGRAPLRLRRCLTRLHDRGAIRLADQSLATLIDAFEHAADQWARIAAVLIALAMFAAFAVAGRSGTVLGLIETVMGYVAGGYLGRMAYYGQLGWSLQRRGVPVVLDPWHADGVGGLKPVGDFCFLQAAVVAVPAAYLAIWLLLIPSWPRNYTDWQQPYIGLLAIAILIQALAFLWPLWSFHMLMSEQKNRWRGEVDRMYRGHAATGKALLEPGNAADKKSLKEDLEIIEGCYRTVEGTPTWPVDVRLRRRFAVNNLLLILPLLIDGLRKGFDWPGLLDFLAKLAA